MAVDLLHAQILRLAAGTAGHLGTAGLEPGIGGSLALMQ
jgi:hypothetical protein